MCIIQALKRESAEGRQKPKEVKMTVQAVDGWSHTVAVLQRYCSPSVIWEVERVTGQLVRPKPLKIDEHVVLGVPSTDYSPGRSSLGWRSFRNTIRRLGRRAGRTLGWLIFDPSIE